MAEMNRGNQAVPSLRRFFTGWNAGVRSTPAFLGRSCLVGFMVAMLVSPAALTIALMWGLESASTSYYWTSAVVALVAVCCWIGWSLFADSGVPPQDGQTNLLDSYFYGRYLSGIGYAMFVASVIVVLLLAGFARRGLLGQVLAAESPVASGDVAAAWRILCLRLLIGLAMAILGGLFFTANALHRKKQAEEHFDRQKFWAGLWFRLGEAVLFTLTVFLALRAFGSAENDRWLPLLGLMLGMFVKSGERLASGIAQRFFAAVSALIPVGTSDLHRSAGDGKPSRPVSPRQPDPASDSGNGRIGQQKEPVR